MKIKKNLQSQMFRGKVPYFLVSWKNPNVNFKASTIVCIFVFDPSILEAGLLKVSSFI